MGFIFVLLSVAFGLLDEIYAVQSRPFQISRRGSSDLEAAQKHSLKTVEEIWKENRGGRVGSIISLEAPPQGRRFSSNFGQSVNAPVSWAADGIAANERWEIGNVGF